jgi:hypothetical protein
MRNGTGTWVLALALFSAASLSACATPIEIPYVDGGMRWDRSPADKVNDAAPAPTPDGAVSDAWDPNLNGGDGDAGPDGPPTQSGDGGPDALTDGTSGPDGAADAAVDAHAADALGDGPGVERGASEGGS